MPRTINATCITLGCTDAVVYASSPIKNGYHATQAGLKAMTLARHHAATNAHMVELRDDGRSLGYVASKCADCDEPTPGSAAGLCVKCAFARLGGE